MHDGRDVYVFDLKIWEALIVKNGLGNNTSKGKHSSSAVSNLLELHLINLGFTLSLKELLSKSKVTRSASTSLKHLGNSDPSGHFEESHPNEHVTQ